MKWNFKRELARKFIHFLAVFILLAYFIVSDFFNPQIAMLTLVFILIIALELEYLRIEFGKKIPVLNKVWAYLRRDREKNTIGGDVFFLLGGILVLAIFDLRIAVAAILMTIFGDLSAALIGSRFGKHHLKYFKDKTWEGILAEFFVNLLIGIGVFFKGAFFNFSLFYNWQLWAVVLVMVFTATIVEIIAHKIDDNLLIPVFAGFNGQIVLLFFVWFF
jgi:dolichol kinase